MSNQSIDGFQGSQPFINDKEYSRLSLDELKYILQEEKQRLKDNFKELGEKQKLINDIKKLKKFNEEVKKGVDILKIRKKSKPRKIKTFDEYFQECIKNKEIPSDTPSYLRRQLLRELLGNMNKELKKKNQLLKILLLSILLKEILILLQLNILIKFMEL